MVKSTTTHYSLWHNVLKIHYKKLTNRIWICNLNNCKSIDFGLPLNNDLIACTFVLLRENILGCELYFTVSPRFVAHWLFQRMDWFKVSRENISCPTSVCLYRQLMLRKRVVLTCSHADRNSTVWKKKNKTWQRRGKIIYKSSLRQMIDRVSLTNVIGLLNFVQVNIYRWIIFCDKSRQTCNWGVYSLDGPWHNGCLGADKGPHQILLDQSLFVIILYVSLWSFCLSLMTFFISFWDILDFFVLLCACVVSFSGHFSLCSFFCSFVSLWADLTFLDVSCVFVATLRCFPSISGIFLQWRQGPP